VADDSLAAVKLAADADVAQLVEHFTRNEGVRGSSPRVGLEAGWARARASPCTRFAGLDSWMDRGGQAAKHFDPLSKAAALPDDQPGVSGAPGGERATLGEEAGSAG
jgi:hypothetical protein